MVALPVINKTSAVSFINLPKLRHVLFFLLGFPRGVDHSNRRKAVEARPRHTQFRRQAGTTDSRQKLCRSLPKPCWGRGLSTTMALTYPLPLWMARWWLFTSRPAGMYCIVCRSLLRIYRSLEVSSLVRITSVSANKKHGLSLG